MQKLTLVISPIIIQNNDLNALKLSNYLHPTKAVASPINLMQLVSDLFAANKNLPIAAITALADELPAQEGWWLRVDPVELHVDATHIFLLGNTHITITSEDAFSLIKELNNFLIDDPIHIIAAHPKRWYLHLQQNPHIKTYPVEEVCGKDITDFLPAGEQKIYWRNLLTEIQMLLYSSVVNQQRLLKGQASINSLWLWGEGQLHEAVLNSHWQYVISNNALCRGLALLSATKPVNLPPHFVDCFKDTSGNCLIVIDEEDKVNWQQDWVIPAVKAVKNAEIAELNLYLGGQFFKLRPPWWRKLFK